MKIQISFESWKKIRSVFNEIIDKFCVLKISDMYLIKIQISFTC